VDDRVLIVETRRDRQPCRIVPDEDGIAGIGQDLGDRGLPLRSQTGLPGNCGTVRPAQSGYAP
jgi:hypothetical protein